MRLKINRRAAVIAGVTVLAVAGGTAAALATTAPRPTTARTTAATTCPYVADGGAALALVTVQVAHGSCTTVDPSKLGSVGSGGWSFTIDSPASDTGYAIVAGDAATSPVACRVSFPRGVTVTVYAGPLQIVEPMVCAALYRVPEWEFEQ